MVAELQERPHHRPTPGEAGAEGAWWWPAHLGGGAPDPAGDLDRVPRSAVPPTWGPPVAGPGH